jgi:hypothetical protein
MPDNGTPEPKNTRTEVRVTYDNEAVYFAATMYDDEPGKILKELNCVVDIRGQWDNPGKCTMIEHNKITMKDVPYPLVGIDDTGHIKLMMPENDYRFPGNKVFEIPLKGKYKNIFLLGVKRWLSL